MAKLRTGTPLGRRFTNDLTIEDGGSSDGVDTTLDADVRGGPCTLLYAQLDNSGNVTEKVYLKLFDAVTATPGTTTPDIIFSAAISGTTEMFTNLKLANGLSYFCSIEAGNTATTSPTTNATGRFITTE